MDSVSVKLVDFSGSLAIDRCGSCADTIKPTNAIKIKFDINEKNTINPDGRVYVRMYLPTFDSTNRSNIQPYSFDTQITGNGILNDKPDSLKTAQFYFPVPDYYPSGFYSVNYLSMTDLALNVRQVLFDKDTANQNYFIPGTINQRAIRDSIYIRTKYPDLKPPLIDLNDIKIQATPTNPITPNGETLFEMWLWVKDESDFTGKASGFANGNYTLRDPQGLEHNFLMQTDLGNTFYNLQPDSSIYGFKRYYFNTLLPAGSPPGLWGVSAITVNDHAQNKKYYSFVEYVRFDVDQSNVLQVTPYVEILGKKVNSKNVDSVGVKIGCKSCINQNYRLRMYSSMGGGSVVYEGKMTNDTINLRNLNLKAVNDGILYATLFMLDSTNALIGTGRASYAKDILPPKSVSIKSNISNFGKSNLDSLIIDMRVNELNCNYNIILIQKSNNSTTSTIGDSVVYNGKFLDSTLKFKNFNLGALQDGLFEIKVIVSDSMGNEVAPIKNIIYKDTKDPIITLKKSSMTGVKGVFTLQANEFISNTLVKDNIKINLGTVDSLKQISNLVYNIYVTKKCVDSLSISILDGSLLDTVGNKNLAVTINDIEETSIVPTKPIVRDTAYCNNTIADTLKAYSLTGYTLNWYGTNAIGGTASSLGPKPNTTITGNFTYYVSQFMASTGCESQRAKIDVTILALPTTPTLSKDTANNLVASSNRITWYKDGTILPDTAQKYKPTMQGAYTVKTTQNGCSSALSIPYYYLVTDVINLNGDEFIKLSPNPFVNQLNFDFILKGYQRLNVQVFDLATGNKLTSFQNLSSGMPLYLGQLSAGIYFIKVSSNDNKLTYQFKMIKL